MTSRWPRNSWATDFLVSSRFASTGYCTMGRPEFSPISPIVSHSA